MRRLAPVAGALLIVCVPSAASAHPVGFGVLQLEERDAGEWDVLLRVSGSRERAEAVEAMLPPSCAEVAPAVWEQAARGVDRRFRVRCPAPLTGDVGVTGMGPDLSMSLRIARQDSETEIAILDGSAPFVTIEDGARLGGSVFAAYAAIGVEHILSGIDHLLFVLGLLLLLRGRTRALVLTITSFTVGHSVTLALATLGTVPISSAAAEAIIALSIVLLAVELTRPEDPPTLTRRYPGLVAGAFGLVHGLGFAGALAEVGLPREDAVTALFAFNVGVEIGQLLFVGVVLAGVAVARRARWQPVRLPVWIAYGIGGLAAYWLLERTVSFWNAGV